MVQRRSGRIVTSTYNREPGTVTKIMQDLKWQTSILNTIKSIKFGLKIILIDLTSIINLIIPFHSVFVTIQQSERNFFLKGTTFVYYLQILDSHIPYEVFCG
jgi:hypothetical protein